MRLYISIYAISMLSWTTPTVLHNVRSYGKHTPHYWLRRALYLLPVNGRSSYLLIHNSEKDAQEGICDGTDVCDGADEGTNVGVTLGIELGSRHWTSSAWNSKSWLSTHCWSSNWSQVTVGIPSPFVITYQFVLHCATRLVSVSFSKERVNFEVVKEVILLTACVKSESSNPFAVHSLFWRCLWSSSSSSYPKNEASELSKVLLRLFGLLGLPGRLGLLGLQRV